MPSNRSKGRPAPYANTHRRSNRQALNRANNAGGSAYTSSGDQVDQRDNTHSVHNDDRPQRSATPRQDQTVSKTEFDQLRQSVSEMRSLLQDIKLSMSTNQVTTSDNHTVQHTTPSQDLPEASTSARPDNHITMDQTIDQHINNIIQGNSAITNIDLTKSGNNSNNSITLDHVTDPISPQGQYIKLDRPLDTKVTDKIRDKIWSNQYIDLGTLLDTHNEETPALQIVSGVGESLKLAPHKPSNKITSLGKWNDAFLVYFSVYTRKYPQEVTSMLSYMQLMKRLAYKGGDFVFYDKEYRHLRQRGQQGWEVHPDLWLEARDVRGNTTGNNKPAKGPTKGYNSSFRGQAQAGARGSHPSGYCYKYHSSGRCSNMANCTYKHVCYKASCGGKHPAYTCKAGSTTNNKAATTNTSK